ncbi:ATP-binding cassette domain-containing protein [Actinomyces respiraculi]|uniref:ATP-binding cassette domain-containing protein n=1 Tax=Actinomyces respiraculi TaxID=2744574 RepID=UPI00141E5DE6|nr:ATP-binding cassette domain-containing protein [Actinomyces respiraculi]
MSEASLTVRRLTRSYPGEDGRPRRVLDRLDLDLAGSETVALLGRSGCGKTTLLRALLLIDHPQRGDGGQILLDGEPVPTRRRGAGALRPYRRAVQYVPQDPAASLNPRRDVLTQVTRALRTLDVPGGADEHEATAHTVLAALDLPRDLWRRRPHEISGGQAQRVALARALAPAPRFLLLDEPVSGLDPALRHQVLDLLAGLSDDGGLCPPSPSAADAHGPGLLVVSHDLAAVARVCRRTLVMDDGQVVEDAPTAQILTEPHHPASRALRDAVPHMPTD